MFSELAGLARVTPLRTDTCPMSKFAHCGVAALIVLTHLPARSTAQGCRWRRRGCRHGCGGRKILHRDRLLLNWRYAPALQAAKWMILDGAVGEIRDVRTEWFARLSSDFFHARPWSANMEVANGSLGEGLAHDLDKVRFLTGLEFRKIASVITPIMIKQTATLSTVGARFIWPS